MILSQLYNYCTCMLNAWLQIVQNHACLIIYLNQIVSQGNSENDYTCVYFDCESFFCATNVVELEKKWMAVAVGEEAVGDEGNILLKRRITGHGCKTLRHFDKGVFIRKRKLKLRCLSVFCVSTSHLIFVVVDFSWQRHPCWSIKLFFFSWWSMFPSFSAATAGG